MEEVKPAQDSEIDSGQERKELDFSKLSDLKQFIKQTRARINKFQDKWQTLVNLLRLTTDQADDPDTVEDFECPLCLQIPEDMVSCAECT